MNITQNPEIHRDRKKTDQSLIAERGKATETLLATNEKTKNQTDQIIEDERSKADAQLADSNKEPREVREDQIELKRERKMADRAIAIERDSADNIIDQALELERRITDENLSQERDSSDSQIEEASASLKSEVDHHSKTKSALTSREELLAIVSHDLRNPVSVVSSYASLILEKDNLDEKVRSFANAIKRNSNTALRLISDLMDMERLAKGKWNFHLAECSAEKLITQTIQDFSEEAKEKNITLTSTLTFSLELFESDHDRLMQVLMNLVSNALKFTPKGGVIKMDARIIQDHIEFSVEDNGIGIVESKQKEIFERFAQLTTRSGLGLGLYISKALIEALKGRMWLESKEGHGSTFFFALPLKK